MSRAYRHRGHFRTPCCSSSAGAWSIGARRRGPPQPWAKERGAISSPQFIPSLSRRNDPYRWCDVPGLRTPANFGRGLIACACVGATGCGASLPQGSPSASKGLVGSAYATNIVGRPGEIYQRIARQATRCWFGPFGRFRTQYIMHADVPAPASTEPVTVTVHRRLQSSKRPWGPGLLRLEMTGTSTTNLSFTKLDLDPATRKVMTVGLTRWANGRTDCGGSSGTALSQEDPTGRLAREATKKAKAGTAQR